MQFVILPLLETMEATFNKLQEIKQRYHCLLRKSHWGRKDMCNGEVKTKCVCCGSEYDKYIDLFVIGTLLQLCST